MPDGLSATQKKQIVSLRKRWKAICDNAKKQNLDIATERKSALDVIRDDAERLGITKSAMNKAMKMCDHLDNAEGVRSEIEDDEILAQFDKVSLALELPGFEEIAPKAAKPKKAKAKKAAPKSKPKPESPAVQATKDFGYSSDSPASVQ